MFGGRQSQDPVSINPALPYGVQLRRGPKFLAAVLLCFEPVLSQAERTETAVLLGQTEAKQMPGPARLRGVHSTAQFPNPGPGLGFSLIYL